MEDNTDEIMTESSNIKPRDENDDFAGALQI